MNQIRLQPCFEFSNPFCDGYDLVEPIVQQPFPERKVVHGKGHPKSGGLSLVGPFAAISQENGQRGNRTPDTRIFSPLLYQLSYLA